MTDLEMWLGRELTETEQVIVDVKGPQWFITNWLEFDKDDEFTFNRIKALITAYCTKEISAFNREAAKDNGSAYLVLKTIADALAPSEPLCTDSCTTGENEYYHIDDEIVDDSLAKTIDQLKHGEVVEMSDDEFDELLDELEKVEGSFVVMNDNGKVSLKV